MTQGSTVAVVDRRDVMTVPNLITLVRLACLPWFVVLVSGGHVFAAGWLLGVLGSTDWVDGWVARRFNQVSEFGKIIDPVADRAVFLVGILSAIRWGSFPAWFGALIVLREAAIAVLMVGATLRGMDRFPVTRLGKAATMALLAAVPWLMVGSVGGAWTFVRVAGWAVGLPGLVASYVSFFAYIPTVRANMSKGARP